MKIFRAPTLTEVVTRQLYEANIHYLAAAADLETAFHREAILASRIERLEQQLAKLQEVT